MRADVWGASLTGTAGDGAAAEGRGVGLADAAPGSITGPRGCVSPATPKAATITAAATTPSLANVFTLEILGPGHQPVR
jgi:hypothetical protein